MALVMTASGKSYHTNECLIGVDRMKTRANSDRIAYEKNKADVAVDRGRAGRYQDGNVRAERRD